jgi:hypothetical protein
MGREFESLYALRITPLHVGKPLSGSVCATEGLVSPKGWGHPRYQKKKKNICINMPEPSSVVSIRSSITSRTQVKIQKQRNFTLKLLFFL